MIRKIFTQKYKHIAFKSALLSLLAFALIPATSTPVFAQQASCEAPVLRIASTRDFKASPQGRSLIFETLVALDDRGEPVPLLAKSWLVSADGLSYTFELQESVEFSNGTFFTAEIAAHSINMAKNTAGFGQHLKGVEILGPHTIRIQLIKAYWPLLHELSFEHISKMTLAMSGIEQSHGADNKPAYIGTGPFVLESYSAGKSAQLTANSNYWKGKPTLKQLSWKTMPDPETHATALNNNEVDIIGAAEHHGAISYSAFNSLKHDPRFETRFRSYGRHQVIDFNVGNEILQNIDVRRAIALSIDRERLVNEYLEGIPAMVSTLSPAKEHWPLGQQVKGKAQYNPQKAKLLLNSIGWTYKDESSANNNIRMREGKSLALRLLVNKYESNALAAAVFVKDELSKIGINVKLDSLEGSVVSKNLKLGNFDMHLSHSCSAAQLGCLSANGKYTAMNETKGLYISSDILTSIDKALSAKSDTTRQEFFSALWQELDKNVVGVPLFDVVKPMTHNARIKGIEYGANILNIGLSNVTFSNSSQNSCGNR